MHIGSLVLTPGNKPGVVMGIGGPPGYQPDYQVQFARNAQFRYDDVRTDIEFVRFRRDEIVDDPAAAAVALARAEAEMIVGKVVRTTTILAVDDASGQPWTLTLEDPIDILIGEPDEDHLIRWTAEDTLSPMYPCTPLGDAVESLAGYSPRGVRGRSWKLNGESALPDFCELVGYEPAPSGPSFR